MGDSIQVLAITDGTSNTILFGEASNFEPKWPQYAPSLGSAVNTPYSVAGSVWTKPGVATAVGSGYYPLNSSNLPLPPPTDTFVYVVFVRFTTYGSGHLQGANFVFCDGSVHFLSNAINNTAGLLSALSTRAGGEVIDDSAF
jgi:prepilin-type processing-associated H-X9-DG protein